MLKKIQIRLPFTYYPYKRFMHKHKCIFVHIPKNAGSSVLALFCDKGGRKHAKWYDFFESNDYFFKQYHKFAIVREPLARLYSAYCYCVNGGNHSADDLALKYHILAFCTDFESFVKDVLNAHFIAQHILFTPQYLFIFDRQLNCAVDSVLRYESLAEDWKELSNVIGCDNQLPVVNVSDRKDAYTLERLPVCVLDKINELYRYDFELLNYSQLTTDNLYK